jgi:hypothetical protein
MEGSGRAGLRRGYCFQSFPWAVHTGQSSAGTELQEFSSLHKNGNGRTKWYTGYFECQEALIKGVE